MLYKVNCSIGGNLFNLSINEDLKAIQKQFPQLSVKGLHDDITIMATKRSDFGALIEAAIFMSPLAARGAELKDEHEKDAFHVLRFKRND